MANGKPGAPKGHPKHGGRMAGVKNKTTRAREQRIAEVLIAENLSPDEVATLSAVQVLCRILRAEVLEGDRAGAKATAAILAPYQSAKLSSSDVRISGSLDAKSDAEIEAELAEVQTKLAAARVVSFPAPRLIQGAAGPSEPVAEADVPRWRDEVI